MITAHDVVIANIALSTHVFICLPFSCEDSVSPARNSVSTVLIALCVYLSNTLPNLYVGGKSILPSSNTFQKCYWRAC